MFKEIQVSFSSSFAWVQKLEQKDGVEGEVMESHEDYRLMHASCYENV